MTVSKHTLSALATLAILLFFATRSSARELTLFQTVAKSDFVAVGVGGLRGVPGGGTLNLTNVSGTVTKAYLYWHGHAPGVPDFGIAGSVLFNDQLVTGPNVGVSAPDGWEPLYAYGQAYRADVTSLITGNGLYTVRNFSPLGTNVQGASLLVCFDDGNSANDRDIIIFDGNDSNQDSVFDASGWNLFIPGVNYTAGDQVALQLHVSDGQRSFRDGALILNNYTNTPEGHIFSGTAPYGSSFDYGYYQGSLWDIGTFDITSFLSPGVNNLLLTSTLYKDDLSLIVATVSTRSGTPPPPPPPNNQAPTLHLSPGNTISCASPGGTTLTISADVSDANGDPLTVVWKVNGVLTQTDTVPAGSPTTVAQVTLVYNFLPGDNTVTASVFDPFAVPVTGSTTITVTTEDFIPPQINACAPGAVAPANNVGQAAVPNFAAQIVATDNCSAAGSLVISQSPPAGTLVGVGTHPVIITVTDAALNAAVCSTTFTVSDVTAPTIACGSSVTLTAGNNDQAIVPDLTTTLTVADNVTPLASLVITQSPAAGTVVGVGTQPVTLTVRDAAGNVATCSTTLTVAPQRPPPPTVNCSVGAQLLWPPNHELRCVGLNYTVSSADPKTLTSVKVFSNEDDVPAASADNEKGKDKNKKKEKDKEQEGMDDQFSPDAINPGLNTLALRSERLGTGPGRVYLIVVTATDSFGQKGFCTSTVGVPHDQSTASKAAITQLAASASAYYALNGVPPADWFVVGDGPVVGPKQTSDCSTQPKSGHNDDDEDSEHHEAKESTSERH
jgi:hypothetical protein